MEPSTTTMIDRIKFWLIAHYGPANSQYKWWIAATVLLILTLPKSTRRPAGIALLILLVSWFLARNIFQAFLQYTPQ